MKSLLTRVSVCKYLSRKFSPLSSTRCPLLMKSNSGLESITPVFPVCAQGLHYNVAYRGMGKSVPLACRNLSATPVYFTRPNLGVGGRPHQLEESPPSLSSTKSRSPADTAWVVRLANENGYLSWCRNTYLASAVACGMQAEGTLAISQLAAQGVFLLAGINLIWGTLNFITYTLAIRKRAQMSLFATLVNVCGSVAHLVIWLALVMMYLGLTEDPVEELPEIEHG